MRRPGFVSLAVMVAFALLPTGCGGRLLAPTQTRPAPRVHLAGAAPLHIAVILMENEEYGDIIGQGQTPYINSLAHRYALATRDYAIAHPSLPNYLALTGGTTHGIDSDCTDCSVPGAGLAGQLGSHRVSWRAYMEGLPHPCYRGDGPGDYAKRHDPFVYYRAIARSASACSHVVPLNRLAGDERSGRMPAFSWITPNLCHDMHDCSAATGDRFLRGLVPPLLRALGSRGVLLLTWDEGTSDDGCCKLARGGHIALVVAGGGARASARMATPIDHYTVLQAIEDLLRLPRLGGAGCGCTPSLQPLLRARPRSP